MKYRFTYDLKNLAATTRKIKKEMSIFQITTGDKSNQNTNHREKHRHPQNKQQDITQKQKEKNKMLVVRSNIRYKNRSKFCKLSNEKAYTP